MVSLTPNLVAAWEDRQGPAVLGTCDAHGQPNVVYVGSLVLEEAGRFVIADSAFFKTRANIEAGSRAALLWLTSQWQAYQVHGAVYYETGGPIYERMLQWVPAQFAETVKAAAVVEIETVYCGASKLLPAM